MYPRVYKLTDVLEIIGKQEIVDGEDRAPWGYFADQATGTIVKPKILPPKFDKIYRQDCYLMDDGDFVNLLVSSGIRDNFIQEIFGYDSYYQFS